MHGPACGQLFCLLEQCNPHRCQCFAEAIREIESKKKDLKETLAKNRSVIERVEKEIGRRTSNIQTVRKGVFEKVDQLRRRIDEHVGAAVARN